MSALPLFDVVLSSHGRSRVTGAPARDETEFLTGLTDQLIRSALGELRQIEALDACLAGHRSAAFDEQAAAVLRGMYDQWVRDADAVLDRAGRAGALGVQLASAVSELRDAQGRVRAALAVTPEAITEARADFDAGRTYSTEEVRRELRAGVQ
jgi:hypothetical protein